MLPAHVGAYVGRLLRGVPTVGTAVPRRLSALELYVRVEIILPVEDTRAIPARKLVHLCIEWHRETARAYQICKKTFGTRQSSSNGRIRFAVSTARLCVIE